MSKRKRQSSSAAEQNKRSKTYDIGLVSDGDNTERFGQNPQDSLPLSTSSVGDIGVIESITMKNFMCHNFLKTFQFGPNVNFIVGNNGSGKSAILTALIVGLGGKATVTNRGVSLKGFVKNGESSADVIIKLRNRGTDAYKGDLYGDCISIEQRISSDGSRTCKLKSKTGQLVSNKKEELMSILDHFNIQVDNPVSILNQEMSKQFLHSKSEADKYRFFMKATLLEQMKRDYIHIKQTKAVTRDQVEKQEEGLKGLKQKCLQKKERYENLSSMDEMKRKLEDLQQQMAWSLVIEKERQAQLLKEQIENEEKNNKYIDKLELFQTKVTQAEKKCQEIQRRLDKAQDEEECLLEECRKVKEELKAMSKTQKDREVVFFRAENKLKQLEKDQIMLQERIELLRNSGSNETEVSKWQGKISTLTKQMEEHETEVTKLNQLIKEKQRVVLKGKEEFDKLRLEEKHIQGHVESNRRRRNQLMACRSNRLKRFGDRTPELLEAVDEAHTQGRFLKKPVGPIGACISLKDPTLALAVESCLQVFMRTFCCDNYEDERILQELMSQHFPKGSRPQIIVIPFIDHVYNTQGRGVNHPEFPSVLDTLDISSPVIANCLIDMRSIETVLVIKDSNKARQIMQTGSPPRNCREAFTGDGDQVFACRYYSSESRIAKYLVGDLEAEIRLIESELENKTAQLTRFQVHSTSMIRSIQSMERELQSLIVKLKKNQTSLNQVKAQITELENMAESQTADISSLEEEAEDNRQKIDSEKLNVNEAKRELDKIKKLLIDTDAKHRDLRNKMEQLVEETEPVKEELVRAEAECNKVECALKISEKKQKDCEDNIQDMKNELAFKEVVIQEFQTKAQKLCPQRLQVERSAKSIDSEINRLRDRIDAEQRNHGNQEQIVREFTEALENYRRNASQVRDLKRFIDQLENIMNDRQARYKTMRRSLSVRCKLYFNDFLIKLHCCGSMMFDHNNETLSISVKPPGQEDDDLSNIRSLSGGERSFSTVCFILALWEITESPFRCLDEFDVYMDMHNRRVSMDLLLGLSERQHLRQFIFITPQSTNSLPKSDLIKVHQLQDPERSQSQAGDEEEEHQ